MEEKTNYFKELLFHILFWCIILLYDAITWGYIEHNYTKNIYVHIFLLPPRILVGYVTGYLLIPKFLYTKRYVLFAISTIVFLIIGGIFNNIIHVFHIFPKYDPEILEAKPLLSLGFILVPIWNLLPSTGILSAYLIVKRSFRLQKQSQALVKEKLAAELNYLRSQVHPHFLFNTLNNLYALTLKNAKETPTVVLKLSELLNYMLYESSMPFVPLEKELQSIKNYLALEQLRYGESLEVTINVKGSVENVYITPLLLIPLVENCFKHGPEKGINDGWVDIDLTIKDQFFVLKIENSKSGISRNSVNEGREGIGLKNVKRRLELIYKNNFDMKVMDESDRFMVVLKLDLNVTNNVEL
jgi:two-component system, LytTR family, sensor kinase